MIRRAVGRTFVTELGKAAEEGVFFEDCSNEILDDDELSRLLTFPNVLVTSHQAFLTREALMEIARIF